MEEDTKITELPQPHSIDGPLTEIARDGARRMLAAALMERSVADAAAVAEWLNHPYFDRPPPKSLDRQDFAAIAPDGLTLEDGAATLTAFIVGAVARAREHVPAPPEIWIITGGGRHNPQIMQGLSDRLGTDVRPAEAVGWDGDALEAQAFAYLAVRTVRGLPITFPTTTGAPEPLCGGRVFHPA